MKDNLTLSIGNWIRWYLNPRIPLWAKSSWFLKRKIKKMFEAEFRDAMDRLSRDGENKILFGDPDAIPLPVGVICEKNYNGGENAKSKTCEFK